MRLRRWCWKMPNSRQLLKLRIMKGENFWSWWRTSYASHHPRWWTLQTLKDKTVQRVINLKQFCAQYDLYVERKKIFVQKCATLLIGSTGICNAHDLSVCGNGIYLNNLLPWLKYVCWRERPWPIKVNFDGTKFLFIFTETLTFSVCNLFVLKS